MFASSGAFAEFHESGVEALTEFAHAQFAALERLLALNFDVARRTFNDGGTYAKALLVTRDTPELSRLGAALALPALDRTLVYSLGVCELGSHTQGNVARLFDAQATGISNSLSSGLEKLAQYAPPGSGMAVKAAKSALQNANSAIDTLTEFGVKTSEFAQTKLASVTAAIGSAEAKSAKDRGKNDKVSVKASGKAYGKRVRKKTA